MTTDERREFVHRAAWMIVPGLLSGFLTAGAAVATIHTQIGYLQDRVEALDDVTADNRDLLTEHRVYEHETIRAPGGQR